MKVISQGVHPREEWFRGTCSTCKTAVEFQRKEAKTSTDQRDGDLISVSCPTCSSIIYGSKKLPVKQTYDYYDR